MSPYETQQVEAEPLEELLDLDVHEITIVATTTTASTASCGATCGCTHVTGPKGCLSASARTSSARGSVAKASDRLGTQA